VFQLTPPRGSLASNSWPPTSPSATKRSTSRLV